HRPRAPWLPAPPPAPRIQARIATTINSTKWLSASSSLPAMLGPMLVAPMTAVHHAAARAQAVPTASACSAEEHNRGRLCSLAAQSATIIHVATDARTHGSRRANSLQPSSETETAEHQ